MGMIFDFSLSKCGGTGRAPIDRLAVANNRVGKKKGVKFSGDRRLICIINGEVGIVPVTENSQPFKLLFLNFDPFIGLFLEGTIVEKK